MSKALDPKMKDLKTVATDVSNCIATYVKGDSRFLHILPKMIFQAVKVGYLLGQKSMLEEIRAKNQQDAGGE